MELTQISALKLIATIGLLRNIITCSTMLSQLKSLWQKQKLLEKTILFVLSRTSLNSDELTCELKCVFIWGLISDFQILVNSLFWS